MDSVFTKIINKEFSCHLVAEDQYTIAFMDIKPIQKGHVLVVPKKQVDYLFDLDKDEYHNLWGFVQTVAQGLKKSINCSRIGVSVVGFEVPHAHIHLIPINSIQDMNFSNRFNTNDIELSQLSKDISKNILLK
jgi:histidine triad (HIT) family protein|tara:strand:- start:32 stop:430 length:399 start_codon:yes stop_codon:yes gene_type:complete